MAAAAAFRQHTLWLDFGFVCMYLYISLEFTGFHCILRLRSGPEPKTNNSRCGPKGSDLFMLFKCEGVGKRSTGSQPESILRLREQQDDANSQHANSPGEAVAMVATPLCCHFDRLGKTDDQNCTLRIKAQLVELVPFSL